MYLTRKKYIDPSPELDELRSLSAQVWNDVVEQFWAVVDHTSVWLDYYALQDGLCTSSRYPGMAAKSIRQVARQFTEALNTWRSNRNNPNAKPPHKHKNWNVVRWPSQAISLVDGELRLSRGRGCDPLTFDWDHPEPKTAELNYDTDRGEYYLCCQYEVDPYDRTTGNKTAGVDLGLKRLATTWDGEQSYSLHGGEIRSKQRYLNKLKAKLDSKIDRKQRGSNRWWKLVDSKRGQCRKIRDQIDDILHKMSRRLVETCLDGGVSTLVIGDVRGIRGDLDYGSQANQQLHQWVHGRFRRMVAYKARMAGMGVDLIDESYTSQTCPSCGERNHPNGRDYECPDCGWSGHRDVVGAMNIRRKYLGEVSERSSSRVVGARVSPSGIRFDPNAPCSSRSGTKTIDEMAAA